MNRVSVRSANGRAARINDPEGTRRNIVEVALDYLALGQSRETALDTPST